jgi:hypothetical protein
MTFLPSYVTPHGTPDGELKLSKTVEENPLCLYIKSTVESLVNKLIPSKVTPYGWSLGELKLSDIVVEKPLWRYTLSVVKSVLTIPKS